MATRYRRVPQSEPDERADADKKKRAERVEKITAKIHALIWVIVSAVLIYYSHVFEILADSSKTNRYMISLFILLYLLFFLIFK